MSLNDTKIRNLKSSAKPFKVSDSHGLYPLVNPDGLRLWYLKYRIDGKESRGEDITFGQVAKFTMPLHPFHPLTACPTVPLQDTTPKEGSCL